MTLTSTARRGGSSSISSLAGLATGESVIECPSPLNVLKDTYDHSCYSACSDKCQHLMTDSPTARRGARSTSGWRWSTPRCSRSRFGAPANQRRRRMTPRLGWRTHLRGGPRARSCVGGRPLSSGAGRRRRPPTACSAPALRSSGLLRRLLLRLTTHHHRRLRHPQQWGPAAW
jgi:hypothetical protein